MSLKSKISSLPWTICSQITFDGGRSRLMRATAAAKIQPACALLTPAATCAHSFIAAETKLIPSAAPSHAGNAQSAWDKIDSACTRVTLRFHACRTRESASNLDSCPQAGDSE